LHGTVAGKDGVSATIQAVITNVDVAMQSTPYQLNNLLRQSS